MNPNTAIESQFLELVHANEQRILRVCRVYAWTPQDQEDLYQEILFQIWRALPGLQQQAHAHTWLYRVALNTGISYVRKKEPENRQSVPLAREDVHTMIEQHQLPTPESDPRLERLYDAIGRLEKVERGVITLFLEDLTYEEMAEVLGLSPGHVGVMLHRAKKKLSQFMQQEEVPS